MLNVHHRKSTEKPGASVGTRKQVIPSASPGAPLVRAKIMSQLALCSPEFRAALPARLHRQPVAQVPRRVGAPPHLAQQLLPLAARTAALLPVRARVLAPVVEELEVLALERRDLALDERVELVELLPD